MTESKKYRLYTYDKALRRTINRKYKKDTELGWWKKYLLVITCGALFQMTFISITIIQSSLGVVT